MLHRREIVPSVPRSQKTTVAPFTSLWLSADRTPGSAKSARTPRSSAAKTERIGTLPLKDCVGGSWPCALLLGNRVFSLRHRKVKFSTSIHPARARSLADSRRSLRSPSVIEYSLARDFQ